MVLEAIISPNRVEKNILWAIPLGFMLSVVGLAIGLFLFPKDASLVGILFTTLAGVPFLRGILTIEEVKDEKIHEVIQFLRRNERVIKIYFLFFLGVTLSYIVLHYVLPADIVMQMFSKQISIFPGATPTGLFFGNALFQHIVINNLKIALIALILSFIYGAGAIMILTWNASALAIFLVSLRSFRAVAFTLPHAILEFSGFFIAAVAGGLISIAAERDKLYSKNFQDILTDGLLFFLVAVLVIVIAAVVEVTIGVLA
jgi:uncharacterized membrane protein SpoIIM required for sporulation